MDSRYLQYIVALSEEKSLTKASKRLGVSQPAITAWLNSVESQLGTKLVIRSKKELVITPAGKIYLDGVHKILKVKQKTFSNISGLFDDFEETIYIGGTPQRGASLLANVFADFQTKFPRVSLKILENYNHTLVDCLINKKIDLLFSSNLDLYHPNIEYINSAHEEMVLLLPRNHDLGYDTSSLDALSDFPTIDLEKLAGTPFIMHDNTHHNYNNIMQILKKSNLNPKIVFQTNNIESIYNMVKNGCGAGFVPRFYFSPTDNISAFSLNPKLIHNLDIGYRKGHTLTDAQKYLIHLVIQHTQQTPVHGSNNNFNY